MSSSSLPADLSTLESRLTATRAAYIDNLSAGAVAQAGVFTATRAGYLDNLSAGAVAQAGVFTATRAGYIDNLSAGAVALQSTVAAIPSSSITSVQHLTITIASGWYTANGTISAVNTAKTVLIGAGNARGTAGNNTTVGFEVGIMFLNSTTVKIESGALQPSARQQQVTVVEYN